MAVVLYFSLIIGVLLVGSAILGVTFYHWFKDLRRRIEAQETERGGS